MTDRSELFCKIEFPSAATMEMTLNLDSLLAMAKGTEGAAACLTHIFDGKHNEFFKVTFQRPDSKAETDDHPSKRMRLDLSNACRVQHIHVE